MAKYSQEAYDRFKRFGSQDFLDEQNAKRQQAEAEEAQREEERKQRAISAAQAVARAKAQEQQDTAVAPVTPTPTVETPVQTVRAVDNGYTNPVEPMVARPRAEPAQPRADDGWRRSYTPAGPVDAVKDWWQQSAQDRAQVPQMFAARRDQMTQDMRNFALNPPQNAAGGVVGKVADVASRTFIPQVVLPGLDAGVDFLGALNVPGTNLNVKTVVGAAGTALGQAADQAIAQRVANEQSPDYTLAGSFGQNSKILFDSFGDVAQYWLDEVEAQQSGWTPTQAQLDRSTPEQIAQARALSRSLGYSGTEAVTNSFDAYLDNPIVGQEKIDRAGQLSAQAQTMPDGPERQRLELEAGILGAEGLRLRDMTPLEIWNDNQVWGRELAAGLLLDPLQVVGWTGDAAKLVGLIPDLTPMGRRLAQATRVMNMAEDAPMNYTPNLTGQIVNKLGEAFKTGTSKAKVATLWNWKTISELTSVVATKEDVVTLVRALVTDSKRLAEVGIETSLLTTPGISLQDAGGFLRLPWASIKTAEFADASKVIRKPGFADAVAMLPSLRAKAAGEFVDKKVFQSDLNGLLQRWSGQYYGVSAMDGVPYGATSAKLVPGSTPGTHAIQFTDGKTVLSTTIDTTLEDANMGLKQAEWAMKRGEEYKRNPLTMAADWQRSIFSTFTLNTSISSFLTNLIGGISMALYNTGDPRVLWGTRKHLEWATSRTGGMFTDLRVATGAGGLPGATGINVGSAGYWRPNKLMDTLTLGLSEKGRSARNAAEEAMAGNTWGVAFKRQYERGMRTIGKDVRKMVSEYTQDPKAIEGYTGQLVQAMMSGDRARVAQVAADIANGSAPVSVRAIDPAFAEVLDDVYVTELDDLLKNVDATNQAAVQQRINDIFAEQAGQWLTSVETGLETPKRYYWTSTDRIRNTSEWLQQLEGKLKGKVISQDQFNALLPLVKEADRLAVEANGQMLGFLQMVYGRPDTVPHVYGTWLRVMQENNKLRRIQAELAEDVEDALDVVRRLPGWNRDPALRDPRVVALYQSENARLWPIYHDMYTQAAAQAGKEKLRIVQEAMTQYADGSYLTVSGSQMSAQPIRHVFDVLAADPDEALRLQSAAPDFRRADPQAFDAALQAERGVTDKFTTMMFMALQRYPSADAMDEFMSAVHQSGKYLTAAAARVRQAEAGIVGGGTKQQWDVVRAARKAWGPAYKKAWERLQLGSTMIVEHGLLATKQNELLFQLPNNTQQYRLIGEYKGAWKVMNEATGQWRTMPKKGGVVPQSVVDAFTSVRKTAQAQIAEEVGTLARQAGVQGVGVADIDAMINAVTKNPFDKNYAQLKANVAEHMANARPTVVVPGHMEDFMLETLGAAGHALSSMVPQLVQMRGQGYGAFGPQFINRINNEILPRMGNVVTAADRAGKSAVSVSLVDYYNNYWPDVAVSVFSPYHFWFTRMGKNALEQAFFNPKMTAGITRLYNSVYWENESNDVPNRNMYAVPGVQVETDDAYIGFDVPFARWLPILPLMVQNGWADPSRVETASEFILEAQQEGGWPGSAKGMLGQVMMSAEVMKKFGLGVYPWQEALLSAAAGQRIEQNLGSLGAIPRMLGWSSVKFGQWLREQGLEGAGQAVDVIGGAGRPFYEPYLVGRQGSYNANRGLLSDVEAKNVQDVGYQRFFGAEALPEQLQGAEEQYAATRDQVSSDYLLRQFLQWMLPVRFNATYKGEAELTAANAQRWNMGYETGQNLGGSKAAQTAMFDEVPGLSARQSQYAVTGEIAPQTPDPNAVRPGISAAQGQFFPAQEEIYAKYNALIEEEYAKHPEWAQPGSSAARDEVLGPLYDARQAELEALEQAFPSIQDIKYRAPNAPSKLAGTNPQEARAIALTMALRKAEAENAGLKPGDYPPSGRAAQADWRAQSDQYNAAVTASLQRIMAEPNIGSQLTPGRELPGAGVQAPYQASPYAPQLTPGISGMPNVTENGNIPTTAWEPVGNPWSAEMQAAEQQYGLPPGLLSHVAQAESGFDPDAKSGAGAVGLMQFMSPTWSDAEKAIGVTDINDPVQQVNAAGWYLDWLRNTLPEGKNDLPWVLAAYNLGVGKVMKMDSLDELPPETAGYVASIMAGAGSGITAGLSSPDTAWAPPGDQTQAFGARPEYYSQWNLTGHEGVDYGAPIGTPVSAAAGGTVKHAGPAPLDYSNYGNLVIIDHGNGKETWYAHLDGWSVKAGDTVKAGDSIAAVGNTGNSDGAHLHFAVKDTTQADNGNLGFIDPAVWLTGMETGTPTATEVMLRQPVSGQASPAPSPANNIDWGTTAGGVVQGQGDRFKGPNQLASEQAVQTAYTDMDDRIAAIYPDFADLVAQYERTEDADRAAFKDKYPEIRAVNFLAWNPDAWQQVEDQFGAGIMLAWATQPKWAENDSSRANYWRKNPDVFLAHSWIRGRPQPYTEDGTQDNDFSYNLGADFEQAKEMFGPDIWDVVKQAKAFPPYEAGNKERAAAWAAFKAQYPQYQQWSDWWYANLPDLPKSSGYGYSAWSGGGGYNFGDDGGRVVTRAPSPYRRSYDLPDAPVYEAPGGMGSDWRQWLRLNTVDLKTWRR